MISTQSLKMFMPLALAFSLMNSAAFAATNCGDLSLISQVPGYVGSLNGNKYSNSASIFDATYGKCNYSHLDDGTVQVDCQVSACPAYTGTLLYSDSAYLGSSGCSAWSTSGYTSDISNTTVSGCYYTVCVDWANSHYNCD